MTSKCFGFYKLERRSNALLALVVLASIGNVQAMNSTNTLQPVENPPTNQIINSSSAIIMENPDAQIQNSNQTFSSNNQNDLSGKSDHTMSDPNEDTLRCEESTEHKKYTYSSKKKYEKNSTSQILNKKVHKAEKLSFRGMEQSDSDDERDSIKQSGDQSLDSQPPLSSESSKKSYSKRCPAGPKNQKVVIEHNQRKAYTNKRVEKESREKQSREKQKSTGPNDLPKTIERPARKRLTPNQLKKRQKTSELPAMHSVTKTSQTQSCSLNHQARENKELQSLKTHSLKTQPPAKSTDHENLHLNSTTMCTNQVQGSNPSQMGFENCSSRILIPALNSVLKSNQTSRSLPQPPHLASSSSSHECLSSRKDDSPGLLASIHAPGHSSSNKGKNQASQSESEPMIPKIGESKNRTKLSESETKLQPNALRRYDPTLPIEARVFQCARDTNQPDTNILLKNGFLSPLPFNQSSAAFPENPLPEKVCFTIIFNEYKEKYKNKINGFSLFKTHLLEALAVTCAVNINLEKANNEIDSLIERINESENLFDSSDKIVSVLVNHFQDRMLSSTLHFLRSSLGMCNSLQKIEIQFQSSSTTSLKLPTHPNVLIKQHNKSVLDLQQNLSSLLKTYDENFFKSITHHPDIEVIYKTFFGLVEIFVNNIKKLKKDSPLQTTLAQAHPQSPFTRSINKPLIPQAGSNGPSSNRNFNPVVILHTSPLLNTQANGQINDPINPLLNTQANGQINGQIKEQVSTQVILKAPCETSSK
jgi:hypothetical protein